MEMNQNRISAGIIVLLFLPTSALAIYFLLKGNLLLARLIPLGGLIVWGILIAIKGGFRKKWHWILLALLIISFVVSLGYYLKNDTRYRQSFNFQIPSDNDLTQWKTYKNQNYGFEFKYPSDFQIFVDMTPEQQKIFSSHSFCAPYYPNTVVCLYYIGTRYKDTDFEEATLLVQKTDATSQVCLMPTKHSVSGTINGIPFAYDNVSLSFNEGQHYETYHNGQCLDITLSFSADPSAITNNPSTKEFSVSQRTEIFNYLSRVLSTFKFID